MRVYNPEGSLLRRDQKRLVELLKVFAEICRKHDIKWWLCSGTLLGAARHGGFIPWDDDIDVCMMKKEYRRLVKVMKELDEDGDYFYQCIETEPEHVRMHGRFIKKGELMPSADLRAGYYKHPGISMDVFCIEKSSQFAAHMAKFFYLNMQHPTMYVKNRTLRRFLIRLVQVVNFGLLIPLTRLVGLVNPKNDYHCELGSGFYDMPFHVEDIFPLTTIEFEGVDFPAPGNIDSYLTRLYGDWRQIPSEEMIRKYIHTIAYKEEIFGKEEN